MTEITAKEIILKNRDGEYLIPYTIPYTAGDGINIDADGVISATGDDDKIGVKRYSATESFALNDFVINYSDDSTTMYRSLIDDNLGNALTDTTYWEEIDLGGSGDYVTLDTKQTINGAKMFTGIINYNSSTNIGMNASSSEKTISIGGAAGPSITKNYIGTSFNSGSSTQNYIGLVQDSSSTSTVQIGTSGKENQTTISAYASSFTYNGVEIANADLSNLSDTGKHVIDGQWVASEKTLSTATAAGTYTIDLSDYLPDDNYNYEVQVHVYIYYTFTTGSTGNGVLKLYSDICPYTGLYAQVSGHSTLSTGAFLIPTNKKIMINISSKTNATTVKATSYRRIGTNS